LNIFHNPTKHKNSRLWQQQIPTPLDLDLTHKRRMLLHLLLHVSILSQLVSELFSSHIYTSLTLQRPIPLSPQPLLARPPPLPAESAISSEGSRWRPPPQPQLLLQNLTKIEN
jgi:hypothetical protein